MVIYSGSWEEHLRHLNRILLNIGDAGLTLNVTKCEWAKQEAQYLGFLLGNGEVRPQVDKVEAVRNCPRPQMKKRGTGLLWVGRMVPKVYTRVLQCCSAPDQPDHKDGPESRALDGGS